MADEPYDVLAKGDNKIFRKNTNKTDPKHPDLLPVGYDDKLWPTIKFNEALFEKMKENDGVVQVAIYVQDDDSLKVMFKPKWVNPNPKNKAGVQSPTPDAPAISDGELDDEVPF